MWASAVFILFCAFCSSVDDSLGSSPSASCRGPCPQRPADVQGERRDPHRIVPHRSSPAQRRTGDQRVSEMATTHPRVCGRQRSHLRLAAPDRKEKTAEAIQQDAAHEGSALLEVIFAGLRRSGGCGLEAIETAAKWPSAANKGSNRRIRRLQACQNRNFSANWNNRGGAASRIWPNSGEAISFSGRRKLA